MVALIGAGAILLLTIALIVTQPRGLSESWTAVGGAVAMLLLRFATLSDLWAVVREVYGVLLFLLGMMALTAAVERS
ncbi:MAG: ArsB/NhaD family transporter, partial [Thermomicrobiales bacterium]